MLKYEERGGTQPSFKVLLKKISCTKNHSKLEREERNAKLVFPPKSIFTFTDLTLNHVALS